VNGEDISQKPFKADQRIEEAKLDEKNSRSIYLKIKRPGKPMSGTEFVRFEKYLIIHQYPKLAHLNFEFWPKKLTGKHINVIERFSLRTKEDEKEHLKRLMEMGLMEFEYEVELSNKKEDGVNIDRALMVLFDCEVSKDGKYRNLKTIVELKAQRTLDDVGKTPEQKANDEKILAEKKKKAADEKEKNDIIEGWTPFVEDFNMDGETKVVVKIKTRPAIAGLPKVNSPKSEWHELQQFLGEEVKASGMYSRVKAMKEKTT
jgi:hypothetical protein